MSSQTNHNHILIVEDDKMIRDNIALYLEEEGFIVQASDTGKNAFGLLTHFQPSIAIMDIRLPDMNGNEVMKKILEKIPQMKFIVHTGYLEYTVPDYLQQLGEESLQVLFKPLPNLEVMLSTIHHMQNL